MIIVLDTDNVHVFLASIMSGYTFSATSSKTFGCPIQNTQIHRYNVPVPKNPHYLLLSGCERLVVLKFFNQCLSSIYYLYGQTSLCRHLQSLSDITECLHAGLSRMIVVGSSNFDTTRFDCILNKLHWIFNNLGVTHTRMSRGIPVS